MIKVDAVFGIEIEVYTKIKPICKKYNSESKENFDGLTGRALHLFKNGEHRFIIYLGELNFVTTAHEVSHVTTFIMDFFEIDDDEFRSYLIGHVCRQIEKKLL